MAQTVLLYQANVHSDLSLRTQVIDTNIMGGCITVILKTANRLRAQHCAGGIQALTADFWDIAHGDPMARAVIVGLPTGNDQARINDHIRDCGVNHVVHLLYSQALVHIPLLNGSLQNAVSMCVVQK